MPPASRRLTRDAVVDAAVGLLDEGGPDAMTLSAVARAVGVRAPSLYHHVDGLTGLRGAVRARGAELLAESLREAAAGRAGRDALRAVARAYLAFAHDHPGLYAATLAGAAGDDPARPAAERVLATVAAVLRGYGIEGEEAVHATRILRGTLHGFADLERAGGFALPHDREATIERMLAALDAGLARWAEPR